MNGFVVAIPAGPSQAEVARVADLVAALRAHEPATGAIVVVDDRPRNGAAREWPDGVEAIANPRAGRGIGTLGGTCAATLAALAWAAARAPGSWVLRLDSDALVIGPFAEAIARAWRPGDGVLGSCHRTCNDEPRDLSSWAPVVRMHARPLWTWRHPPRRLRFVQPAIPEVRAAVRDALDHGYEPGEHCIAAGCAISAPMIAAMAQRGWLSQPRRWLDTRLGDDIMLGIMARALGLDLRDLHSVFGLRHIGLADTPEALVTRDFRVIHSVKNDPCFPETEVRAFFAERRP